MTGNRSNRGFIAALYRRASPVPCAQSLLRSLLRVEAERRGIDAITPSGGLGAVVEYVPQVRVAGGAKDLGALHEPGIVLLGAHAYLAYRRPVRRPARSGFELRVGAEQLGAAAHAAVD